MLRRILLAMAMAIVLGQGTVRANDPAEKDVVATALAAGRFKTLAAALKAGGLIETLQGQGPFTVFAPTDDAFARLPEGTVETLLKPENKAKLAAILTYHVIPGKVLAADVLKLKAAGTVNGQRVDIRIDGNEVRVDQARVMTADIACSNGVIHVIDGVLLPSFDKIPTTAGKAGNFQTLLAAAKAAGLVQALSGDAPVTVFAPTDAAFEKLPAGTVEDLLRPENKGRLAAILKYHVVAERVYSNDLLAGAEAKTLQGGILKAAVVNGRATVNGAAVVTTDIDTANGVIHVIDTVLLPPPAPADGVHRSPATPAQVSTICPLTGRVIHQTVRSQSR